MRVAGGCAAITLATVGILGGLAGAATYAGLATPVEGGLIRPVAGARITQGFGCTALAVEPVDVHCPGGHFHSGVDLGAARGTPVVAAAGGRVIVIASPFGYGIHVIVDSDDGLTTLYGHLDGVTVHSGDEVSPGDVIGAVGSTGNSTGPHLHFEIRRDGIAEDPLGEMTLP